MAFSVSELMRVPFLRRTRVERQQIVARGRPVPIQNLMNKNNPDYVNPVFFEQKHWITFCEKMRKLFCWTCLLFKPYFAGVTTKIKAEFSELLSIIEHHESSEKHLDSTLELQRFISHNFVTSVRVADKTLHNNNVTRQREVFKRVIDSVYCVVRQRQLGSHGCYSFNLVNVKDCANFLQFLRSCDKINVDVVDEALDLITKTPQIVNDLVDAMTRVVKLGIKNETHKSTYVSLILSEHAASNGRSQISIVLRYVNQGRAYERFIGFFNCVVGCKSSTDILKIILNTIDEYGITERFLAVSVDGEILSKHSLSSLIAALTTDYPYSYFVPWHSHGFGYVLMQTLSTTFIEFGLFMKRLQSLQNFFESSKRAFEIFQSVLREKYPEFVGYQLHFRSTFVLFVAKYRIDLVEFFDHMMKNCKNWSADVIAKAATFSPFLQEVRTVFFLQLCLKVFSNDFDVTFNFFPETKRYEFHNHTVTRFKNKIGNLHFNSVWDAVNEEGYKEGFNSKLHAALQDQKLHDECETSCRDIMRLLFQEFNIRTCHMQRLKFCDLLQCDLGGNLNFSTYLLSELMAEHGPFFQSEDLKTETDVIRKNEVFKNKDVYEFSEYLADLNLKSVFPQVSKLADFVLTLPFLPASRCKTVSKLRDIYRFSYIPEMTGIPSGEVSVLSVEYETLKTLKDSALFYDDVIARFYEVNKIYALVQV